MATYIKVDGTEEEVTNTSLENLQTLVGGNIEIVITNDDRLIILDEEGKLKNKPVNPKATALTRGVIDDDDLIVGDVVVADHGEIE